MAQKQGFLHEAADDPDLAGNPLRVVLLHFPDIAPRGDSKATNSTSLTSGGQNGQAGDQSAALDLTPPRDLGPPTPLQPEANDADGFCRGAGGCEAGGGGSGGSGNCSEQGGIGCMVGGSGNGGVEGGRSRRRTVVYWTRSTEFPDFDVEVEQGGYILDSEGHGEACNVDNHSGLSIR